MIRWKITPYVLPFLAFIIMLSACTAKSANTADVPPAGPKESVQTEAAEMTDFSQETLQKETENTTETEETARTERKPDAKELLRTVFTKKYSECEMKWPPGLIYSLSNRMNTYSDFEYPFPFTFTSRELGYLLEFCKEGTPDLFGDLKTPPYDDDVLLSLLDKGYVNCTESREVSVNRVLSAFLDTVCDPEIVWDIRDKPDHRIILCFQEDRVAAIFRNGDFYELRNESVTEWEYNDGILREIIYRLDDFEGNALTCTQREKNGTFTEIYQPAPEESLSDIKSDIVSLLIDVSLDSMNCGRDDRKQRYKNVKEKLDASGAACSYYELNACFLKDIEQIDKWDTDTGTVWFTVDGDSYYAETGNGSTRIFRAADDQAIYGTCVWKSVPGEYFSDPTAAELQKSAKVRIEHTGRVNGEQVEYEPPETVLLKPGYRLELNTGGCPGTLLLTVKEIRDTEIVLCLDERQQHELDSVRIEDGGQMTSYSDDKESVRNKNEYIIRKEHPLIFGFAAWNWMEEVQLTICNISRGDS